MIQFLLNQEKIVLQDLPEDTTVLNFLRNNRNLCGTKEGCASGDCGACTVVIAEISDERLEYRAINSCITFIGALQGKQLITVEHLSHAGKLHPVQQAMVDLHGSQCGFCTPGFIMSMFALYKSVEYSGALGENSDLRHKVEQYLGGNLCRCTGYRPIMDATLASVDPAINDQFSESASATMRALRAFESTIQQANTDYLSHPCSVSSLTSSIRSCPQARLVAGSTDIALEVTQRLQSIPRLIHLNHVKELKAVTEHKDNLEIGAAVTLDRCQSKVEQLFPEASELFNRFGSQQIRNHGTIGGNIANASPIGDLPPLLIALGAKLKLQLNENIREIPVEAFFIGYRKTALMKGEFIRSVLIPHRASQLKIRIYKVSKRYDDDISAVCMAIATRFSGSQCLQMTDTKIALGGMASIPCRAVQCEAVLNNNELSETTIASASTAIEQDFAPISDARASSAYRTEITKNLLTRFYLEIAKPQIPTRIIQHNG